jgi:hypothetical protein
VEDQGEPNETRATRSGYLTIRTTPTWARVFVGERRLGETPIFRAPVAAGTHVLRLRVEGDGREIRQRVQVTAGAERRLTVALPH